MEIKRKVGQSSVQSNPMSNEMGGEIENQKIEIKGQKLTEATWFIVLMFFLFPPYGLYLLWKRGDKKVCIILFIIFFAIPILTRLVDK